jgi:hypothetical protein
MKEHTPGPWKYRTDFMDCPYVASKTKQMIADVNLIFVSAKEAKANARLIAAAPDLLEACRLTIEAGYHNEASRAAVFAAQAAIAKAEGEEKS